MRRLILIENAPERPVDLTDAEAAALATAELAVVTREPGGESWLVAAGTKVGVARVGDLQVVIRPKVPVDRLVFLMGYARKPTYWRDHSVVLDAESDLPTALAYSFRRLAAKALEQGLLQGYRTVDDALPVVRGRIRVGDQIARRFGTGLPLEVTYDEFTVDVAENRILLAAVLRLLRAPGIPAGVRAGLQRLRLQLSDVTPPPRGVAPDWIPSRLNVRYHGALRLAELILAGDSFEQRVGDVEVSGFVFDMWRIFEEFVSVGLAEALAPFGGTPRLQHRMHLDRLERVDLRPDFFWTGDDGHRLVLDAKYKAEKPSGFPQADLYQLLAYCTVLGLSEGHLVYAQGNEEATRHDIVAAPVAIHCHTLDLEAEPEDLLHQVAELAQSLVGQPR